MNHHTPPSHAEVFVLSASNTTIRVRCDCPKNGNHFFEKSAARDVPAERVDPAR
jgi:hypothetical protein